MSKVTQKQSKSKLTKRESGDVSRKKCMDPKMPREGKSLTV